MKYVFLYIKVYLFQVTQLSWVVLWSHVVKLILLTANVFFTILALVIAVTSKTAFVESRRYSRSYMSYERDQRFV